MGFASSKLKMNMLQLEKCKKCSINVSDLSRFSFCHFGAHLGKTPGRGTRGPAAKYNQKKLKLK